MKLRVIGVAKSVPKWADAGVEDYAKRLRRFGGVDEVIVKPERFKGDVEAVRDAEAKRILDGLSDRDWIVALDERGEDLTTEAFAALIEAGHRAPGALVFAIGGPYGHGPELRKRAWRTVRLSKMVLNHQVARVMLFEQLYRAYTVIGGEPYHH